MSWYKFDFDPDLNFYNEQNLFTGYLCKYVLEDRFNENLLSLHYPDSNALSLLHANLRSVRANLVEFESYLQFLHTEFQNSDNADDKSNALLSNPTPLDESSNPTLLDEASSLDYGHTDDVQLLIRNKSDDSSMLSSSNGDDTEDSTEDFIYRLRMHRKSNPINIIAGFLNINSIRYKCSPVQHILCNSYVDLLGVSETKLNNTFPDGQFHVDNYVSKRKDRSSNDGGVALYVRSDIPHRRRYDLKNIIDNFTSGLEIIIIEATVRTKERWIYVLEYKPPGNKDMTFYDVFSTLCDLIRQESTNIVILGDYNCDFMADSPLKDISLNLVTEPTYFTNQNGSLIDLCLVSNPTRLKKALNLDC